MMALRTRAGCDGNRPRESGAGACGGAMAAPTSVRANTNVRVRPNIVDRKSVATDGDRGTAGAQEGAHATVDRELRGPAVFGARLRERRRERRGTRGRRSRADRIQLLPDQGPTGHRSGRAGS